MAQIPVSNQHAVDCSQAQNTAAGRLLLKLFYSNFFATLDPDEWRGHTHFRGFHMLTLYLSSEEDYLAFLAMVKERCGERPGTREFVQSVRDAFARTYERWLPQS